MGILSKYDLLGGKMRIFLIIIILAYILYSIREIIENIPGKDKLKMDNKQNDFGDLYNLL